ncbi:MAG: hypothetical protein J6Q70_01425 [Clostridia bacterium]|nr:hypothetical protein [Clostridia bacterium]
MSSNSKKYIVMVLVVCAVIALTCLSACKDNKQPETTTPNETTAQVETTTKEEITTPEATTPAETTTPAPTETVTFPSDEDNDPKQEDVFVD